MLLHARQLLPQRFARRLFALHDPEKRPDELLRSGRRLRSYRHQAGFCLATCSVLPLTARM